MPSVLITGSNRGLGLEFAKQYAAAGYRVFATCRDPASANDLSQLRTTQGGLSIHALDPSVEASVQQLAAELAGEPVDILLNNAGVYGPERQGFGHIDYAAWEQVLRTNVLGPMRLCEAFVQNVAASQKKLMVAITSGMGSIADSSGGSYIYRSSKAALNMCMHNVGLDLRGSGIVSVVVNPGWVQTDMGGASARITPEQSISAMRTLLERLTLEDTGKFLDYRGGTFEW